METNLIVRPAQSWEQFVAQAARRLTEPSKGDCDGAKENGDRWSGGSLKDALRMAEHGWQEGAQSVAALLDTLPASEDCLPDWTLEASGVMPCVPAYIAGEMECMFMRQEDVRPDRRLTLAVPATCSASVDACGMRNYARALAAVVRSLDASGVSVAVYRIFAGRQRGHAGKPIVHGHAVREHGEPLDLGKVAFAFHPAAFRRLTFCWLDVDTEAAANGYASGGRGACVDLTDELVNAALPGLGDCVKMPELNNLSERGLLRESSITELIETMRATVADHIAAQH